MKERWREERRGRRKRMCEVPSSLKRSWEMYVLHVRIYVSAIGYSTALNSIDDTLEKCFSHFLSFNLKSHLLLSLSLTHNLSLSLHTLSGFSSLHSLLWHLRFLPLLFQQVSITWSSLLLLCAFLHTHRNTSTTIQHDKHLLSSLLISSSPLFSPSFFHFSHSLSLSCSSLTHSYPSSRLSFFFTLSLVLALLSLSHSQLSLSFLFFLSFSLSLFSTFFLSLSPPSLSTLHPSLQVMSRKLILFASRMSLSSLDPLPIPARLQTLQ